MSTSLPKLRALPPRAQQRLSSSVERLAADYDAIVVGSGYGGAIAAHHLARAGQRVCVLERGRERVPGEYPKNERDLLSAVRVSGRFGQFGSPSALFDVRLEDALNVIQGSGLGGTSQINAGVALEADPEVFEDSCWPQALREPGALAPYFERAKRWLRVQSLPSGVRHAKTLAQATAATEMGREHESAPLTIRFGAGESPPCTHCGNCCSGCNVGAKVTASSSYLADASRHGAEIFSELTAVWIERVAPAWRLHIRATGEGLPAAVPSTISARVVVLAAGSLGSSEILLRSAERGLSLSSALGTRFSGNGDALAFACGTRAVVHGIGASTRGDAPTAPGPCITSTIRHDEGSLETRCLVQEGTIPAPLANAMTRLLPILAACSSEAGSLSARARRVAAAVAESGQARSRTQTLLMIGHDGAPGQLTLENEQLRIHWPRGPLDMDSQQKRAVLKRTAQSLGGELVDNPAASGVLGSSHVTVHPLGGCPMADRAQDGVVNDLGQVFSSAAGSAVHDGLYVCDGAVVPRSLGANPLLTISALSERIAQAIAREVQTVKDIPHVAVAATEPGLSFEETLQGTLMLAAGSPWRSSSRSGAELAQHVRCSLSLRVRSPSLRAFFADPQHCIPVIGTLDLPEIAASPLCIHRGTLQLFPHARVDGVAMRYELEARGAERENYRIVGTKRVGGEARGLWSDLTRMALEVRTDELACAHGELRLGALNAARMLASLEVTDAVSIEERARLTARFSSFFAGSVGRTFSTRPREQEPPGAARVLALPAAEPHEISAADGAKLLLTRYPGGTRGPVLLAPGFAMSSDCFALPSVHRNIVEHFAANGFDVWSFDYRSSPKLAAATQPYNLDDIALLDWPAAVAHVLRVSDRSSLQVVAHCAGSMTLLMALLAGMQGVRSVVCSQLTLHPVSSFANRVKAGMRLPDLLGCLGVRSLPTVSAHERSEDTDLDHLRLRMLFGSTFHAPQVGDATRVLLPRYFGMTSVRPFEHFSRIIRAGRAVDHRGEDRYLPHLSRLDMPILFLAGAHNRLFLPETSRRTWAALRERNGPGRYERAVLRDYGHLDFFIGDNAAREIFPLITDHLERHAA